MLENLWKGLFDTNTAAVIGVGDFVLCMAVSLVLGLAMALTYRWRSRYTKSFVVTLALLPAVVCVVIMMVNGNVGTGVAVAGAFSLVRFRSAPGTAREICALFLAMGIGLIAGMGYLGYSVLFTLIMCAVFVLYNVLDLGRNRRQCAEKTVTVTIPEDLNYTQVFDDIFECYTRSHELARVKTTNMGSMFRLTYHVIFRDTNKEKEFIVTGIYQSMMNMGEELRVSTNAGLPTECISGGMAIQVLIESDLKQEEIKQRIQDIYPNYEVDTVQEYLNGMIGNILDQLATLKFFIVAVVLVINILISVLTMKTLMARERGEIAMLMSIGFSNRTLRAWQSARISIVLFVAMVLGTLTSKILSPIVIGPIFAMMGGTSVKLVTDPLESYVIFPLILLLATGLASYVCAYEVSKVDLKEINTLE